LQLFQNKFKLNGNNTLKVKMNHQTSAESESNSVESKCLDPCQKESKQTVGSSEDSSNVAIQCNEPQSVISVQQNVSHALPWSWRKERPTGFATATGVDRSVRPGEFVMRALFAEFAAHVEKKTDAVLSPEAVEKSLSKLLQRGEDPAFDQLLTGKFSIMNTCD
jgi:hypothetical protein